MIAATNLGIDDVVAVPALCLAVLALVLVPVWRRLSQQRRALAQLTAALERSEARREALADVAARGFASTVSALEFEAGVLERMLANRLSELDPQDLVGAFADLRRGIERAWAEANLLSADAVARTSAREQLNQRLGDARSVEIARLAQPEAEMRSE